MGSSTPLRLPMIDFSGVEARWRSVRAEVMAALAEYGCFEAVYPQCVPADIREALLGGGALLRDIFSLPLERKQSNTSNKPFHGYLGQIPYLAYESIAITNPLDPSQLRSFAHLMWPQHANPSFCETVHEFSKGLAELDEMVRRMVVESLGLEQHLESHLKSTWLSLRVSEYGAPPLSRMGFGGGDQAEDRKMGLVPHRDKNTLAIICQDHVGGLEIETQDGIWIPVTPAPDSFIVIAGDSLRAWTNGAVYSPLHRILVGSNATRYSTILFAVPEDDTVIQAPPELVDDDHPALFKPYDYLSYIQFCSSEEGIKAKCQLDTYCGIMPSSSEEAMAPEQQQQQVSTQA